jgi:demethylmenaquinone methyltransferase/2-methoxy-6-polyprenyl-1,4-benzoquinol methylase
VRESLAFQARRGEHARLVIAARDRRPSTDDAPDPDDLCRYYEARADEYDSTTYEIVRGDPASGADLTALEALVAALPAARALDVGCGTGWLTRFLRGHVVALDPSRAMLRVARQRLPGALLMQASSPPLPFSDGSFDLVLTSHVYGHLQEEETREAFVAEALRVGAELVVVEQATPSGAPAETRERRTLRDGTTHSVYKRYFTAAGLAAELGGEIVLDTPTFVAVRATV